MPRTVETDLDFKGSGRVKNLPVPVDPGDAVPKSYADALGGGSPLGLWDFWSESWLGSANFASLDGFVGAAVLSGTNNTAIPAAALLGYNPHGVFLRSSNTADGGYRYQTFSVVGQFFGSATAKFRGRFMWLTSFTGRTVRIGFHDATTAADAGDGAYFEIVGAVCSAKTANNTARTTAGTTATLSLNVPYTFDIDVAANGASARFRVFGGTSETPVLDQTITTNIPTTSARSFGAGIVATEVSTTASDIGILYSLGFGTIAGFNRATGRT